MFESKELTELIVKQKQIDALTVEVKALKKSVQAQMQAGGFVNAIHDGYTVDLVDSQRKTVKHSDFATYLLGQGLNGYVNVEYKPNMDIVEAGVLGGQIPQAIYDQYVKVSNSQSLKVKSI